MMRARSCGSSILGSLGSTLAGSSPSLSIRSAGSSKAGCTKSGVDAEPRRDTFGETPRVGDRRFGRVLASRAISFGSRQIGTPSRRQYSAKRPARQRLARIPFALAVMQQPAGREALAQPADQLVGAQRAWSGRARRCSIRAD